MISQRPGAPSRLELGPRYAKILSALLAKGKLSASPILLLPNGLAGVETGFQYYVDGKVRTFT